MAENDMEERKEKEMSSLSAFLNPVKISEKEVVVSERFQENGKPAPFKIRPLAQKENETLIKKYTKRDKKGNETFDKVLYTQAMVAMAVVEPDLESAELQKAYGVLGADKVLPVMLYAGEFATLSEEVQKLSGFDIEINDEIDEAKNS